MRRHLLLGIHLENFMLHRSTKVELSQRPVLLLTGANGSGKTQVLDALLLAMGHHPKRVKKGSLAELVGAFGKEAVIRARLANPLAGGTRPLRIEEAELAGHLEVDEIEVVARIDPESGLSYAIAGKNGKEKRVRRQDVRALFDSVGVSAENRLAFTEEGTVNVFADHSARAKLEWILETTGLAAFRNNLLEAIERTEKALTQLEPMKARLRIERDYLATLEKSLELARRREALEKRLAELHVEEAWSRVAEVEKKREEARTRIDARIEEKNRLAAELAEAKDELARLEKELAAIGAREEIERETLAAIRSRLDRAEGALGTRREFGAALESRGQKIAKDLRRLGADAEAKGDAEVLSRRIGELEAELAPYLAAGYFRASRTPIRRTIEAALHLRRKAKDVGLEFLAGPLFREVRWPEDPGLRRAVAGLLGPSLFSFLVPDAESLARAHALLVETWPDRLPPIRIHVDAETDLPEYPRDIAPLEDLVEPGTPAARLLALAAPGGLVEDEGLDIEELRALAVESGRNLVGPRGRDYYFASGAVGGAFDPRLESLDPERLEPEALERAEEAHRELAGARESLAELQARLAAEGDPGRQAERIRYLREGATEVETELRRVEAEIRELAAEHERDLAAAEKSCEILARHAEDRSEIRGRRRETEQRIEDRSGRVQSAEAVLARFAEDLEDLEAQLAAETPAAEAAGRRPRTLRDRRTVHDERIRAEVQIEEIRATRISLERYEEQLQKVEKMQVELAGSSEHIESLRSDMKERFDAWHREVQARIGRMAEGVNRLLAGVYDGVQLRVDNLHDATTAGFHMEVRRRAKAWRDLVHLSGGEKVLAVEALILSMHLLADSPLHAIDEFTQRLDLEFKAYALDMVVRTVQAADKALVGPYAPQFVLLCPDTIGLEFEESTRSLFQRVVLSASRPARGVPREAIVQELEA